MFGTYQRIQQGIFSGDPSCPNRPLFNFQPTSDSNSPVTLWRDGSTAVGFPNLALVFTFCLVVTMHTVLRRHAVLHRMRASERLSLAVRGHESRLYHVRSVPHNPDHGQL